MYSNCCCSCSLEAEIIKIGQSSHKIYSNNIVNFQESTTILNACTKKSGNLLNTPRMSFLSKARLSEFILIITASSLCINSLQKSFLLSLLNLQC